MKFGKISLVYIIISSLLYASVRREFWAIKAQPATVFFGGGTNFRGGWQLPQASASRLRAWSKWRMMPRHTVSWIIHVVIYCWLVKVTGQRRVQSFVAAGNCYFCSCFCQRLSRFSHDFDACARCLVPTRSILARTRLRAFVRQPVVLSLVVVAVVIVRLGKDRSRCLWWRWRCSSALSRICFRIPTNRSSTLWLSIADTSVYLQPLSFASDLPSARHHTQSVNQFIHLSRIFSSFRLAN